MNTLQLSNYNAQITYKVPTPTSFAATGQLFFTGDGTTLSAMLLGPNGSAMTSITGTPAVYCNDWSGTNPLTTSGRTNIVPYSSDFFNGWGAQALGLVANSAAPAPDGTYGAAVVQDTSFNGLHRMVTNFNATVMPNTEYVASAFVKAGSLNTCYLNLVNLASGSARVAANLTSGAITNHAGADSYGITKLANGWWRIWLSMNSGSGAFTPSLYIGIGSFIGYAGTGQTLYVYGAQVEVGSAPTSYVPTSTAMGVTVPADYSLSGSSVLLSNSRTVFSAVPFGTGNGAQTAWTLATPNSTTLLSAAIYRQDWQGAQLLYATSRTNAMLQSQTFATTWVTTRATVTGAAAVAPDGTSTATKLTEDSTVTSSHFTSQLVTVASSAYTLSVYAKFANRQYIWMSMDGSTTGCVFDLVNGTMTFTNGTNLGSITALPNGWYRCSVTNVLSAGSVGFYVGLSSASNWSYLYSGDGTSGAYIWGAQLEAVALPTSYITTTTTAASVTDYALAGNALTLAAAPVAGAVLSYSGVYTGGPQAGATLTWSGSGTYTNQVITPTYPYPSSWDLGVVQTAATTTTSSQVYDIATVGDGTAIAQDVASVIQTFLGELYFDTTVGLPYFQSVMNQPYGASILQPLLVQAALQVPGVVSAQATITSIINRKISGIIDIIDTTGQALGVTF